MNYFYADFLAAAVALNASATKVNVSDFTSLSLPCGAHAGLLMLTFTRAAGSASLTLDFYFQVSYDGGTTWADYIEPISIETGHDVFSGTTVRVARSANVQGASHIRLAKVVNNDTGNNLTAVNAGFAY